MPEGKILGKNLKGHVKWFNSTKGFGFIIGEGSTSDIFVHYTSILEEGFRNLTEKQEVEYTLIETDRGMQAFDVKKL